MLSKIILAGEGGQGVQTIAQILADAAVAENKEVCYIPNFGVEQRGGVSIAFVQVGDEPVSFPKFIKGDIVIALSGRAVERTEQYIGKSTVFVYDSTSNCHSPEVQAKAIKGIPALDVANSELTPRVFNMIILGAVLGATGVVKIESVEGVIDQKLGKKFEKDPQLRELNIKALRRGMEMVA